MPICCCRLSAAALISLATPCTETGARSVTADAATDIAVAELCVTNLAIEVPALVDHFDDATERAYTGWPERLYLVNREGRVAYKSKPGPFGFKPDELSAALAKLPN